jgi:predicted membrane-bound spermidine synthase
VVILLKDSPLFSQDTVCDKKDIPCDPVEEQVHIPDNILRIGLISIFLSGFVAMTYEIVWIRLLSTVLGSSTYSFSLMLAAFISGITLGSFLISKRMPSTERTFLYFGVCELLIGMLLILTLPFYDKLPFLFFKLSGLFNRTAQTFTYYSMVKFLIAFLIMFPPTIFLGMTLPLVSKLATRNFRLLGKDVGNVFGINTLGNILGAACTGLVIMPALGLKNTMDLGIALNIAMGLVIIAHDPAVSRKIKSRAIVFSVLILAVYKLVVPDWNKLSFIAQVFRYGGTGRTFSSFEKSFSNKDIVFYNDGIDATVSVLEKGQISLFVNGKADASTGGDMIAQVLCAQLPLTLKTDAHDVLVIGLGSGVTCGSALTHPIEKLDLVEISEDVVKASYLFKDYNYSPLEDSRLRLHVEDAKTFLKRTPQKYDVIISEPSNPWMSGVASLFSIEYFSDCKAHLNEGGIMVQWVQAYETTDEIFEIILRTFQTAFDHVYVWNTGMRDILIMGCSFPFSPDINASSGAFSAERIKKDFSRLGINDLFTLLALQTSGPEKIKEFVSLGKGINSDYFPRLEYLAPLALYTKSTVNNVMKEIDERNISSRSKNLFVNKYIEQAGVTETNLSDLFYFLLKAKYYNEKILASAANYFYSKYPNNPDAMFAWSEFNTAGLDESIRVLHALISEEPNDHFIDSYTKLVTDRFTKTSSFLERIHLGCPWLV